MTRERFWDLAAKWSVILTVWGFAVFTMWALYGK
jgi:hypothetical protein